MPQYEQVGHIANMIENELQQYNAKSLVGDNSNLKEIFGNWQIWLVGGLGLICAKFVSKMIDSLRDIVVGDSRK